MADYLEAFARESEEQITELNNALLEFEDDPSDEAAMDQIFRTAHTLKGNCGAMGFGPAEDLAHAIEDLLEAIRSNRVSVTPELMDAIFDGVDELDAMIEEAVQHGEVSREADAEIATLREYAEAEGLAEPNDAEIDELIEAVSAPSDSEHSVYHVRLDVAGDPAVHGRAIVDALDDAFELLGTDPSGEAIDAGDYDGTIDAAFASVVQRAAVEAALEPVDAVADQVIADVTDRVDDEPEDPAGDASVAVASGAEAAEEESTDDLSVDELLQDEEVDQFDDLDEMAEDVGDTSEFEDLGDAGSFADLGITEDDVDIETADDADQEADAADAATEPSTDEPAADDAAEASNVDDNGEVEDAAAEFAQLKEEVDPVGFDELQDELADLEFDEYDSDDEVGFDELLDEDELEDDGAFAESAVTAGAAEDGAGAASPADEPEDAATADTGSPDATAEDLFGGGAETQAADAAASESPATDAAEEGAMDVTADADEAASDATVGEDAAESDETTAQPDDPATTADDIVADAIEAADDAAVEAEDDAGVTEVDEDLSLDEEPIEAEETTDSIEETADSAVEPDDSAVEPVESDETPGIEAAETPETEAAETPEVDTGDADELDATEAPDAEPLDESAESFGEGGLDLSEESAETADDVPAGADELDLGDSFGEMEADAAAEAATEDTAAADDEAAAEGGTAADDAFDLGEDDIDFGEGAAAGTEEAPDDEADEDVTAGGALEDDSFDPDATEDSFEADDLDAEAGAAVGDETESDTADESVAGFGEDDDNVLDLDGSAVAGSEAPSEGEEETLESVDAADVGPGARIPDDADAELDEDAVAGDAGADVDTDAEAGSDAMSATESAVDAGLEDPGFSDGPSSDEDDGPEVDEERIERIRNLGVPKRSADAEARSAGTQSIRVDVESLDRMLNMVEGLVTSRARLRRALIENEPREVLEDELDDLEDVTSELQDTVMDVRLVPLRTAVNKLPRIVRDVAREEDKQVDFEMIGEDVELDRSILDEIGDPLVHLVRNAIDHGIETPDVREAAGKPAEGSVELRATRERDRVTITVEDDGAGIDADAVRDAAVEEGIHTRSEVDSMDDEAVKELIFHSGFSTAAEVTDVSGRGVGMDVVAETVDRLDGTVTVDSEPGEGTTITMELPVTLAIAEVLFVDLGGEEYGIPIKTVDEIGPVVGVETQDGQEVLVSDGGEDQRALIRLDEALSTPRRSDPSAGMLVHLREDVREAAIHCDQVREQQEVVVKPFEGVLGDVPGLSGATVLGDGDVVTILDVETL